MAKRTEKRLRTRGFAISISYDDATPTVYTPLGQAGGFRRRGDAGTAEGMSYENQGHRYPVGTDRGAEISFNVKLNAGSRANLPKEEDIALLRWVDADGFGKEGVEVLFTGVDQGRPEDGLPTYEITCLERSDGTDVIPPPPPP